MHEYDVTLKLLLRGSARMAVEALAVRQLMILAGLRGLELTVEEEIRKMPILKDIMDHKVLGREYKRGSKDGIQQGELRILRKQMERRFGPIPEWVEERIAGESAEDLEALSVRLLDARSLEELIGEPGSEPRIPKE